MYVNPIIGFGLTEGTNGRYPAWRSVRTLTVNVNNNHQFNQDFTMVKGKHAFKFGYEWLWENEVQHNIGNPRLTLGFGQGGNAQTDTTTGIGPTGVQMPNTGGIQLANIMLGYVSSYSYAQQGASLLPVDSNQSFYVQDDWRFLPNLTFNIGLRYENETPGAQQVPGTTQRRESHGAGQLLHVRIGARPAHLSGGWVYGRVDPAQGVPLEPRQPELPAPLWPGLECGAQYRGPRGVCLDDTGLEPRVHQPE